MMIFEYRSTSYLFYAPSPLPKALRRPLKKHITWMTLNQDGCSEEALDFNPPVIPLGVWGQIGTLAFGLKGQSNKLKQNHYTVSDRGGQANIFLKAANRKSANYWDSFCELQIRKFLQKTALLSLKMVLKVVF